MIKSSKVKKLEIINKCLKEVVPNKVTEDVNEETSITLDLALDSIEIMDLLLKIREKVLIHGNEEDAEVDIDRLLGYLFNSADGDVKVQSLYAYIDEIEA